MYSIGRRLSVLCRYTCAPWNGAGANWGKPFEIFSMAGEAGKVKAGEGPASWAEWSFEKAPDYDILLIPGGFGSRKAVADQSFLERLAAETGRWERLAQTLRVAAARAPQGELTLDLYRRIAAIYEQKLDAPHRAIDVHRRILGIKPEMIPSLEVMIAWHRAREEWRDLRDRLRQWIEYAPKTEPRGHGHQIGKRFSRHLAHHLASVRLHRDLADPKLATDLLVQQPRDD